jgi:hypothetical protein
MKSFEQVGSGRWASGIEKPVAILTAEPHQLAENYALRFTRGQDDLDEFQEAAIRLNSGRAVLLIRYKHSPGPGTTVSIDREDHANDAIRELRKALRLKQADLSWVADDGHATRAESPGALTFWAGAFLAYTLRNFWGSILRSPAPRADRVKPGLGGGTVPVHDAPRQTEPASHQ